MYRGYNVASGQIISNQINIVFCLKCAALMPRLEDEAQQARLEAASVKLRRRLVLLHWLTQNEWAHLAATLTNVLKAESLADVATLTLDEERVLRLVKKPKGMAEEVLEAAR